MGLTPLGLRSEFLRGAKFDLGALVITPNAISQLQFAHISALDLLRRHAHGDWGILPSEDQGMNEEALHNSGRLMSVYPLPTGEKVWIITEWDRSVTTILMPEDY